MLGAVTGVMGTLQATEVLEGILGGTGETLAGRLLIWDALASRLRSVRLRPDPACAACGPHATLRDLLPMPPWRTKPVQSDPFAILLISGAHERAHCAFVLATGAAALGRKVVLFATNAGCRALCTDWSGLLTKSGRDAAVRARGVAGIGELRELGGGAWRAADRLRGRAAERGDRAGGAAAAGGGGRGGEPVAAAAGGQIVSL